MTSVEAHTDRGYLTYLRRLMVRRFTLSELETLCFDLGVDVETLPGRGRCDARHGAGGVGQPADARAAAR